MSFNISQTGLQECVVNCQQVPPDGPKSVPVSCDWTTESEQTLDLGNVQRRGFLSLVQSIFVDNSVGTSAVEIAIDATTQTIKVPAQSQAYLMLLTPNPVRLIFRRTSGTSNEITRFQLMNFPVSNAVWSV